MRNSRQAIAPGQIAPGREARTIRVVAWSALGLFILYHTAELLLLAFAAVLVAVMLSRAADKLSSRTAAPRGVALATVVVAVGGGLALVAWLLAPQIAEQSRQLIAEVPALWKQLDDRIGGWLDIDLSDWISTGFENTDRDAIRDTARGLLGALAGTLGVLGSAILLVAMAIYIAADFDTYRRGALRLVPVERRDRARQIADQVEATLLWWMIGKLISMAVVGVLTFFGLWLMGMPLATALAVIAGALAFIPNFGPIIAAVPAVLVALGVSVEMTLYVVGLYVAVQTVESYTITPLIQQRTVALPPALTVLAQLVMGGFAAGIGLAMATPLAAVLMVLVRELYVRDRLEQPKSWQAR